jgi:hypothetical protein
MRETRARPSPAIVVAVLALVAALAGTALAGTGAGTSAINKKKVKKIAKKQINKLAPGLSVAHASTAGNADQAANANALGGRPASAFASSTPEPFRRVGASGQPQFQNDWENAGSPFRTAAFYKDPWGVVHIRGAVDGGLTGETVFTLPPGYRPSGIVRLPAACGGAEESSLLIMPNGTVTPECDDTGIFTLHLEGMAFRVP